MNFCKIEIRKFRGPKIEGIFLGTKT